ncbi:MAG TPA: BamA/TamA family outer membrane protein [Kofleriaceae bacterium]|nr:BamA/TamA family outer membrane protein [Kofleriaceae bacterium]
MTLAALVAACHHQPVPVIPGHTDIHVREVAIEPRAGEALELDYKELKLNLGLRPYNRIYPERTFNPFRLAEDRRRVLAFLQDHGRFDAEVDEPIVTYTPDRSSVSVTWKVHEGVPYRISELELVGVPPEHDATLRAMIPFHVGDEVDIAIYRPLRRTLAERLQDEGYGHARGYSRTFVDKDKKTVAWFYYIDPGPKTRIGTISVEGANHVSASSILDRAGLAAGSSYSTSRKRAAELALLDTGAFASAAIISDADIQTGPPEYPETGGVLAPEQVDDAGNLVPRKLPEDVALRVVVVEAPARQLRAELGIEADPTRVDSYAGARVTLRNLFGSQHHLVLEGNVGYGWIIDDDELARGVYGSAQAQYVHPGWLVRSLDLRMTTRWRDVLYPDAMLREVVAGPGVRSTIKPGVFVDFDAFYRYGKQIDFPALDMTTRDALSLPADDVSQGPELVASVIADRRNDRVEPTAGWLLGARTTYSPGGSLADHRWLELGTDARGFLPLSSAWSLGGRVSSGFTFAAGDDGVPLGARQFGGGAFGMRGFGRDRLSPTACPAGTMPPCDGVVTGGLSLVEASVEARFLPFRKLYGAAAFVDAGAAGPGLNPVENGVAAAVGLGGRIRSWYVPVALDVSYRFLEGDLADSGILDRFLVFLRVGEAF